MEPLKYTSWIEKLGLGTKDNSKTYPTTDIKAQLACCAENIKQAQHATSNLNAHQEAAQQSLSDALIQLSTYIDQLNNKVSLLTEEYQEDIETLIDCYQREKNQLNELISQIQELQTLYEAEQTQRLAYEKQLYHHPQ